MKCEECLPLLEEFSDGELLERAARRVTSHIDTCAACASAFEELQHEAELFTCYQRDVEVTPALWNAVRARITEEKEAQAFASFTPSHGWLAGLRHALRFNPVLVSALALVIVCIAAGIGRYFQLRGIESSSTELAYRKSVSVGSQNSFTQSNVNDSHDAEESGTAMRESTSTNKRIAVKRNVLLNKATNLNNAVKKYEVRASSKQPTRTSEQTLGELVVVMQSSTTMPNDNLIAGSRTDVIKHIEQSQVLLRSFRNTGFSVNDSALDIAYERRQSQKLLYQNILLRRDAAAKGNLPIEEALNSLEPMLLDIANLPPKPSPDDVRSIKERIQKNEIVAELQVYTTRTASLNY